MELPDFGSLNGRNNEQLARVLGFFIKLNAYAVPLYTFLLLDIRFAFVQDFVRDASFFLLNSAGFSPALNGYVLSIPITNGSWGAVINWDCTGWKSLLFMFALVMAAGRSMDKKLAGLAVLLPLVFAVNIARIFFMFWIASTNLALFPVIHAVVWSFGLLAAVLIFWILWMKWDTIKEQARGIFLRL